MFSGIKKIFGGSKKPKSPSATATIAATSTSAPSQNSSGAPPVTTKATLAPHASKADGPGSFNDSKASTSESNQVTSKQQASHDSTSGEKHHQQQQQEQQRSLQQEKQIDIQSQPKIEVPIKTDTHDAKIESKTASSSIAFSSTPSWVIPASQAIPLSTVKVASRADPPAATTAIEGMAPAVTSYKVGESLPVYSNRAVGGWTCAECKYENINASVFCIVCGVQAP